MGATTVAPRWTNPDPGGFSLAFSTDRNLVEWRQEVDVALRGLLGRDPEAVPLDVEVQGEEVVDGHREIRFSFATEPGERVPATLVLPLGSSEPVPVVICLQGHTSGMHISLGRTLTPEDEHDLSLERDYAVQVVRRGWAALAIEQRGFGERGDARPSMWRHGLEHRPCHQLAMSALLQGRTLLGERVWDVSRAIDALSAFDGLDLDRIACVGDSTGGTVTYFAACLDPRITVAMPAAYVCSLGYSLLRHDHCEDHYLPGFLRYFDLGDLAVLIAPRPLIVVTGAEDVAFPLEGAEDAYRTISAIYERVGAPEASRLVVGPGGHQFYGDLAWPEFTELSGWTAGA